MAVRRASTHPIGCGLRIGMQPVRLTRIRARYGGPPPVATIGPGPRANSSFDWENHMAKIDLVVPERRAFMGKAGALTLSAAAIALLSSRESLAQRSEERRVG